MDSRTSESYGFAGGTKPVIRAYPLDTNWTTAQQFVKVVAAPAQSIVMISSHQTLQAGTTSQAYSFQLRDGYGNPSPVDPNLGNNEDALGQGVSFRLTSDSTGTVQFSSPGTTSFALTTGTAKMALGEHTTTFYLIDTLAGGHSVFVDEIIDHGWTVAVQTYTVTPAPPRSLAFITPPRKLIAGTTVAYDGVTDPRITVQLRDAFGNVSSSTQSLQLQAQSNSSAGQGSFDNISFSPINAPNSLILTFDPGETAKNFYYKDTIAGVPAVTMLDPFSVISSTNQAAVITPNSAARFTLSHPFALASPLSVRIFGTITVTAREARSIIEPTAASRLRSKGLRRITGGLTPEPWLSGTMGPPRP
jgi:hypothetical protein